MLVSDSIRRIWVDIVELVEPQRERVRQEDAIRKEAKVHDYWRDIYYVTHNRISDDILSWDKVQ